MVAPSPLRAHDGVSGGFQRPTNTGTTTATAPGSKRKEIADLHLARAQSSLAIAKERVWPDRIAGRLHAVRSSIAASPQRTNQGRCAKTKALRQQLARLVNAAGLGDQLGVTVQDVRTHNTVFERGGHRALNPASNIKLLTATAAMELLGPEFRFETRFAYLEPTLYVIGGGDPSLQYEDLRAIVSELKGQVPNLQRIVVDESAFSAQRLGPDYDRGGPGYSYLAPSAALSLQFNTLEIRVSPSAAGKPVRVRVSPPSAHVIIDNTATTRRGPALSIETQAQGSQTVVRVRGSLRRRHAAVRMRRRIHNPGHFAASTLAQAFAAQGFALPHVELGTVDPRAQELYLHRSAPLPKVLRSALHYSNNFTTEQILRTLGHLASGEPGDWDNGRATLQRFWTAAGQDPGALTLINAAGMTRRGRVTSDALAALAGFWADETRPSAKLLQTLPIAGRQGTVRRRLRGTHGAVLAKSGSLTDVSALTGVVLDRQRKARFGFSILVNASIPAYRAKRLQDQLVRAMVEHVREPS